MKFNSKFYILHSTFLLLLCAPVHAGVYFTGFARTTSDSYGRFDGTTVPSLDRHGMFDRIFLDATVGYAFNNGFRIEADIARIGWDSAGADFSERFKMGAGVGFVRGLYDIRGLHDRIAPYFGLGIQGVGFDMNGHFDLSLVGGLTYKLGENYALDLQYSRVYTNYFEYIGSVGSHYRSWSNELRAGLRYSF